MKERVMVIFRGYFSKVIVIIIFVFAITVRLMFRNNLKIDAFCLFLECFNADPTVTPLFCSGILVYLKPPLCLLCWSHSHANPSHVHRVIPLHKIRKYSLFILPHTSRLNKYSWVVTFANKNSYVWIYHF